MKTLKGANGDIVLYDDYLTISKNIMSGNSNTTINLVDVVGVLNKSGGLTRAHIKIETASDRNDNRDIVQQPNVVLLKMGQDCEAMAFKNAVEAAVRKAKAPAKPIAPAPAPAPVSASAPTVINNNPTSMADEIKKLKELMDQGILTEDEFTQAKKKILGI